MKKFIQTVLITALFVVPLVGLPAIAHASENQNESETETETFDLFGKQEDRQNKAAEVKERVRGRLNEVRLQVCELRVDVINRIMDKAAEQGTKHLGVFTKILDRVKDFYKTKNLSVDNYQDLLDMAEQKAAAAQTAINTVADGTDFVCNSDDPVGKVDKFNGSVRAMHKALKEYRTAIKDVIVGIVGAAKQAEQAEGSQD